MVLRVPERTRHDGTTGADDGRVDTAGAEQLVQVWAAEAVMRE